MFLLNASLRWPMEVFFRIIKTAYKPFLFS